MRFTNRKTLFTDRIPLLSIRSIRTDRQTVYDHSCHENILSPTNEMRFTDRKTLFTDRIPLLSIRSICTDRHMAYTDRYGAGVLDNPRVYVGVRGKFSPPPPPHYINVPGLYNFTTLWSNIFARLTVSPWKKLGNFPDLKPLSEKYSVNGYSQERIKGTERASPIHTLFHR